MIWDGVVRLPGRTLAALADRHGGHVPVGDTCAPTRIVPVQVAGAGDLAPLVARRFVKVANEAAMRGASLLVDPSFEGLLDPGWLSSAAGGHGIRLHPQCMWAMAEVLDDALVPDAPAVVGEGCSIAPSAVLGPRVVIGARVTIGAGVVIGHPGFGWAFRADGAVRAVPQLAGVVIENDVAIGPLSTVDAGTLAPTRIVEEPSSTRRFT